MSICPATVEGQGEGVPTSENFRCLGLFLPERRERTTDRKSTGKLEKVPNPLGCADIRSETLHGRTRQTFHHPGPMRNRFAPVK